MTEKNMKSLLVLLIWLNLAAGGTPAQSGGDFEITGSVIAGGGSPASNDIFELDSTTGQPMDGNPIGSGNFSLTGGFWNYTPLAPTAAPVSISGRVLTPTGAGLYGAVLYLETRDGDVLVARSSSFGYYRFDGIPAGQTVLISVQSKRYSYTPRSVSAVDEIVDFDFTPEP